MLKYKEYTIVRLDNMNLGLSQVQNREIYEPAKNGGKGKGKGTGKYHEVNTDIGIYQTLGGCFTGILEREAEKAQDIAECREILRKTKTELKAITKDIDKKINKFLEKTEVSY